MYTGLVVDNSDISDRQASEWLLVPLGSLSQLHREALSMDPIHPSLSDLMQVQSEHSHCHSEQRLTTSQDEKTAEVLNF